MAGERAADGERRPRARRAARAHHQPRQRGDVRHRELGHGRPCAPSRRCHAEKAIEAGFEHAGGRAPSDVVVQQPRLEIVVAAPPGPVPTRPTRAGGPGLRPPAGLEPGLPAPARRRPLGGAGRRRERGGAGLPGQEPLRRTGRSRAASTRSPTRAYARPRRPAARCSRAGPCPSPTPASRRPTM